MSSFLGRFQLGTHVPLQVLTTTAEGTATVPTDVPTAKIFSSVSRVTEKKMPVADKFGQTGLFILPLFLNGEYSVGYYSVSYNYCVGSYCGVQEAHFEVIPGGSADGSILAMHFYERPEASHIVWQTDAGRIQFGRNPSLS